MIGDSFKQQCPTCEAMVTIKNAGMVGKKMECPKCKDKFIVVKPVRKKAEEDDDEGTPAPARPKPAAAVKQVSKPKADSYDVEDDDDEPPTRPVKKAPVKSRSRDDDDEEDDEDEKPAVNSRIKASPVKKPSKKAPIIDDDEDDEVDYPRKPAKKKPSVSDDDEDDEDSVPVKSKSAGKPSKKVSRDDDEEDEDAPPKKSAKKPLGRKHVDDDEEADEKPPVADQPKKRFGINLEALARLKAMVFKSKKTAIGAGLAVVGVVVLLAAGLFMLFSGGGDNTKKPITKNTKKPVNEGPVRPGRRVDEEGPIVSANKIAKEVNLAQQVALLPADSEQVVRFFVPALFKSIIYEAAFRAFDKAGPFHLKELDRRLGFQAHLVDDILLAQRFPSAKSPGWSFTVLHVRDELKIPKLIGPLKLERVRPTEADKKQAAKNGTKKDKKDKKETPKTIFGTLEVYKVGAPQWLELLGSVAPGVPPSMRLLAPRRQGRPLYLHLLGDQTLILADEEPMLAFAREQAKIGTKSERLSLRPEVQQILNRMELQTADQSQKEEPLFATVTLMREAEVHGKFKGEVIRYRPRPVWDITPLLEERRSRISTMGTALVRKAGTSSYKYYTELHCGEEVEAQELVRGIEARAARELKKLLEDFLSIDVELTRTERATDGSRILLTQGGRNVELLVNLNLSAEAAKKARDYLSLMMMDARAQIALGEKNAFHNQLGAAAAALARDKDALWHAHAEASLGRFPPGAFPRMDKMAIRDPGQRVSWMASMLPYLEQEGLYDTVRFDAAWHSPLNWPAGRTLVPQFIDPGYPESSRYVEHPDFAVAFAATHFVGVAGVGLDAGDPTIPHRRGIFGYDRSISIDEIQKEKGRGLSNTIMMLQVPYDDLAGVTPWLAGGGSTIRGVPEKDSIKPFIGKGRAGTLAVFADGAVYFISADVDNYVFQSLCTVEAEPIDLKKHSKDIKLLTPAPRKRK